MAGSISSLATPIINDQPWSHHSVPDWSEECASCFRGYAPMFISLALQPIRASCLPAIKMYFWFQLGQPAQMIPVATTLTIVFISVRSVVKSILWYLHSLYHTYLPYTFMTMHVIWRDYEISQRYHAELSEKYLTPQINLFHLMTVAIMTSMSLLTHSTLQFSIILMLYKAINDFTQWQSHMHSFGGIMLHSTWTCVFDFTSCKNHSNDGISHFHWLWTRAGSIIWTFTRCKNHNKYCGLFTELYWAIIC